MSESSGGLELKSTTLPTPEKKSNFFGFSTLMKGLGMPDAQAAIPVSTPESEKSAESDPRSEVIHAVNSSMDRWKKKLLGVQLVKDPMGLKSAVDLAAEGKLTDAQKDEFAQFEMLVNGIAAMNGSAEKKGELQPTARETILTAYNRDSHDDTKGKYEREEGLGVEHLIDFVRSELAAHADRLSSEEAKAMQADLAILEKNSKSYAELHLNRPGEEDAMRVEEHQRTEEEARRIHDNPLTKTGDAWQDYVTKAEERLRHRRELILPKKAETVIPVRQMPGSSNGVDGQTVSGVGIPGGSEDGTDRANGRSDGLSGIAAIASGSLGENGTGSHDEDPHRQPGSEVSDQPNGGTPEGIGLNGIGAPGGEVPGGVTTETGGVVDRDTPLIVDGQSGATRPENGVAPAEGVDRNGTATPQTEVPGGMVTESGGIMDVSEPIPVGTDAMPHEQDDHLAERPRTRRTLQDVMMATKAWKNICIVAGAMRIVSVGGPEIDQTRPSDPPVEIVRPPAETSMPTPPVEVKRPAENPAVPTAEYSWGEDDPKSVNGFIDAQIAVALTPKSELSKFGLTNEQIIAMEQGKGFYIDLSDEKVNYEVAKALRAYKEAKYMEDETEITNPQYEENKKIYDQMVFDLLTRVTDLNGENVYDNENSRQTFATSKIKFDVPDEVRRRIGIIRYGGAQRGGTI